MQQGRRKRLHFSKKIQVGRKGSEDEDGGSRGNTKRGQSHNWMSTQPCAYCSNSLPFSRL